MQSNSSSSTATVIARSLILASHDPDLGALVPKESVVALKRIFGGLWSFEILQFSPVRWFFLKLEAMLLPGIITHYLARKHFIEDSVKQAIKSGCRRVVVVGAGYDTLAWRLHRQYPEISFLELDHPMTQERKKSRLGGGKNLGYLALDLSQELPSACLDKDELSTVFVVEGLTMYLSGGRVREILSDLVSLAGEEGRLVWTFMEKDQDGSIGFRGESSWVARWLSWCREPFLWGLKRSELDGFSSECGMRIAELVGHEELGKGELKRCGLDGRALARGEMICIGYPRKRGVFCNDKHSKLNATRVAEVRCPTHEEEVMEILRAAARKGLAVSVCGGRHAMGGQQFGTETLLLDLSALSGVGPVDRRRGLVEVKAGTMWPELIDSLHSQQAGEEEVWSIRQKQTGADDLALGGSLAANIHGRGLEMKPIIDDVEAFTLIDGSGQRCRCSRNENEELFRLAIGGYGCFGVITSVELRLAPRRKLERLVKITTIDRVIPALEQRIREGSLYGDFQFSIDEKSDDFLNRGVLSTYRPVDLGTPVSDSRNDLDESDWERLIQLAHHDRARAFKEYTEFYLASHGSVYWSDTHQLSIYLEDYHTKLNHDCGAGHGASEMISELFVPRGALVDFMKAAADLLRDGSVPLIYGTVRLIRRDEESAFAWAREDFSCVIFNLHTEHNKAGIARAEEAFRGLINLALSAGGSYYLTYHRWARPYQVKRAHPKMEEFLEKKDYYDPDQRFQSNWWRHYREMFS